VSSHAPIAECRVRQCALQLSGRRDREQQRGLLPGATPDAGHSPQRRAQLAAVAHPILQQQERRLAAKVERERVVIAALPELD